MEGAEHDDASPGVHETIWQYATRSVASGSGLSDEAFAKVWAPFLYETPDGDATASTTTTRRRPRDDHTPSTTTKARPPPSDFIQALLCMMAGDHNEKLRAWRRASGTAASSGTTHSDRIIWSLPVGHLGYDDALAHCRRLVDIVAVRCTRRFYVGATVRRPEERFFEDGTDIENAHYKKFASMQVLYTGPWGRDLEIAVIKAYRLTHPRCENKGRGGERIAKNEDAVSVYVCWL